MVHRVGEKLHERRIVRGYSLEEVSKATKIKVKFLEAIEKGDYRNLPSSTYAHGFIKNYAAFLGLPESEISALFKREYNEEKIVKVLPEGLIGKEDFPIYKFKFSKTFKILPLIFLLLLLYLFFQYRAAIFSPSLNIVSPMENAIITSSTVIVVGKTDPDVTVFVNSELATLDKNGNFKKTITIFPGKAKITIKSVNNFNRSSVMERHVEIKPAPGFQN